MANVQIYRLQFIANNPFGTFVTGDVVDIFMETDDAVVPAAPLASQGAGITVLLNGVSYPSSGAGFMSFDAQYVSIQEFNPQICIGTSLLNFGLFMAWPYSTYYSEENHYSCTVNPPTCNLMVNGVPVVIPATDTITTDGSIQINATSTNPIEYAIGADFVYGEGQTEPIFNGLLAGQYRIYLRDSANCAANILVTVPVDNSYGSKYRLEYTDNNSVETRIDITMRGYSGSISEICGSGAPFEIMLRGEGSQDKFEPLMSSQANFNLVSLTDLQFLELYTNDPNLYRINYSKRFGETAASSIVLPALADWLTSSLVGDSPDWNIGTSTPNVTIAGVSAFPVPSISKSEYLYTDYTFVAGDTYTVSITYDRVVNSMSPQNPRSTYLLITDTSFNIQFSAFHGAIVGSNTLTLSFVANAASERIAFNHVSGSNVTLTVNDVSGTTNGHQLLWLGKILPQQYSEEYKAPPYYVSAIATDGLAELKTHYLIQGDGQKYVGTIRLIDLVAHCLRVIKLDLNIRVACNLYAIDMDQTDSDDPFDQAYVDFECFYLEEKEPTLEFVLRSILEPFGARITLWEGRWNIVRVEEMLAAYDYRDFDKDGEYITNSSFDPVMDIEYPDDAGNDDLLLVNRDHNLEMRPGYGAIKAVYRLGLKPNIFRNGDFRLNATYYAPSDTYFFSLNKDGWTLVNGGYPITEEYEWVDQNNIAYKITSTTTPLGGEAYVQSDTYFVRMGSNNQLKISVTCKVGRASVVFDNTVFTVDVPYVKIRIRVKYGPFYLQGDGSWTTDVNLLTFYCTVFNKYEDYEMIANQPITLITDPDQPVDGMDLDVRVYHAYAFHSDFTSFADLRALETWDGSARTIPTGYKTEVKIAGMFGSTIYYYELEESTETEVEPSVIDPDDSNGGGNARRWILKAMKDTAVINGANVFSMSIDKIVGKFLTDGNDPIDSIVRTTKAEKNNTYALEKRLIIGSYSNLIVTNVNFGLGGIGLFFPTTGGIAITTTSVLSADLIYSGYLRDSTGVGYENFARDGVAESDKLHGILLKSYALQYRKSWRLLRGSIYAKGFFGLLNVARLVNDGGRIYLPMGLTLNDKMCTWSGEFHEIGAVGGGSDGSGTSPYSSGFTVGFGSGGFN